MSSVYITEDVAKVLIMAVASFITVNLSADENPQEADKDVRYRNTFDMIEGIFDLMALEQDMVESITNTL